MFQNIQKTLYVTIIDYIVHFLHSHVSHCAWLKDNFGNYSAPTEFKSSCRAAYGCFARV